MLKLILLGIIGFVIYKMFWKKSTLNNTNSQNTENDNELIECSKCHTFVPKSECEFRLNGCICKDCR